MADVPFVLPEEPREVITGEVEPTGGVPREPQQDNDWLGFHNQGGGHVPEDYEWPTNPKQRQEELSSG